MSRVNNTKTNYQVNFILFFTYLADQLTKPHFDRKLYLMEPLCQTQIPAGGHDSSELLHRLEAQETKVLESEQRCRKLTTDLQKVSIL